MKNKNSISGLIIASIVGLIVLTYLILMITR